jgi:SulP family sulfate permease
MGAWDFVIGILIGIVLACISLVVQTSRKSPIRATYSGVVARSTVRRHPTQQRFLREVGAQTEIVKLAGYMFFGTVASVESHVHSLLDTHRTTRFVILDLFHVSGIDFSAAEAFTRMRRLMAARGVEMILSGVTRGGEIGRALRAVGVWDHNGGLVFETLNGALEFAENEFLKALYTPKQPQPQPQPPPTFLDVPPPPKSPALQMGLLDGIPGSPRRTLVHNAAQTTLRSDEVVQSTKWAGFRQPLPLLLQTFQGMTERNEDFWFAVCRYFVRRVYDEGTVVFRRGVSFLCFDMRGHIYPHCKYPTNPPPHTGQSHRILPNRRRHVPCRVRPRPRAVLGKHSSGHDVRRASVLLVDAANGNTVRGEIRGGVGHGRSRVGTPAEGKSGGV